MEFQLQVFCLDSVSEINTQQQSYKMFEGAASLFTFQKRQSWKLFDQKKATPLLFYRLAEIGLNWQNKNKEGA